VKAIKSVIASSSPASPKQSPLLMGSLCLTVIRYNGVAIHVLYRLLVKPYRLQIIIVGQWNTEMNKHKS